MSLKNLGAALLFLYIKGTTKNYSRRSGLTLDTYDRLIPRPGANSGLRIKIRDLREGQAKN
jgi:hypothetical protein